MYDDVIWLDAGVVRLEESPYGFRVDVSRVYSRLVTHTHYEMGYVKCRQGNGSGIRHWGLWMRVS